MRRPSASDVGLAVPRLLGARGFELARLETQRCNREGLGGSECRGSDGDKTEA